MTDPRSRAAHLGIEEPVRAQIDEIVAVLGDILGEDLVGAYLHGSAVLGGLRARSDIDVLAVSARRMRRHEKDRLVAHLLAVSGRYPPAGRLRPIELTIVVASEVRPWRYPPRMEFQYGEWWRERFEAGDVEPWRPNDPDLAVLLTMTLLGNAALVGPPPSQVFDAVPERDLLDALVAGIPDVVKDIDSDTTNAVLTLARIWSCVVSGAVQSKDGAADWTLSRLPTEHRAVVAHAREIYLGTKPERWDHLRDHIRPFADQLVAEIDGALSVRLHGV